MPLIDDLYCDVVHSYLEEGPYSLPNIEKVTEMYNAFNEIIESTSDCVDKRILIFRDILQMISIVKSTHIEKLLAEQRVEKLIKDNEDLGAQVAALITSLSTCTGEGENLSFNGFGKLMLEVINPKPFIYVQALFNVKLAWYYYLYGDVVKPKEYAATVDYVIHLELKKKLMKN